MSTDEYVPSEDDARKAYVSGRDPMFVVFGDDPDPDSNAEFDRFLVRVRRDAAREALDGLAAEEEDSFLSLHVKDAPIAAAQCTHAAITAREYRDTHYPIPEEIP